MSVYPSYRIVPGGTPIAVTVRMATAPGADDGRRGPRMTHAAGARTPPVHAPGLSGPAAVDRRASGSRT